MSNIRKRIEILFEDLGRAIYRNRVKTLILILLFIGGLISQLPKITFDTSMRGNLHEQDPILLEYNAFQGQFGGEELIIIAIKPPDVFDAKFLKKLKAFHEELEKEVPYLRKVNSLISARSIRGEGDALVVGELLDEWPEKDIDFTSLREQVMNNPAYRNLLVSEDGRYTTVTIETEVSITKTDEEDILAGFEEDIFTDTDEAEKYPYLSNKENSEVIGAVRRIMARYNSPDFSLALAGASVIANDLMFSMKKDMSLFIVLSIITIIFFLALFFRKISGVILPMIVIMLSLSSTVGLMALFNIPIKTSTQILPSFLLAVGVGNSVHVLAIFYHRFAQGTSKEDALAYALGHSGLAIVMTSLTTAAGLFSFVFADIASITDLGIFASIGVLFSLLFTIIMLPVLISFIPLKQKEKAKNSGKLPLMDRMLNAFADFAITHPVKIVIVSAVIIVVSTIFACRIEFSHKPLDNFPDTWPLKKDTILIDQELKGTTTLEVIVDTGEENGIYEPEILNRIEELSGMIEKTRYGDIFVGKVFSINDIIKEIHQALNENDNTYYVIPQERRIVAQELLLFESSGSGDLERVADSQFQKARFTVKMPYLDAVEYESIIQDIEEKFCSTFKDKASINITGIVAVLSRTVYALMLSTAKSYLIAFFIITIMMILLIGKVKVGLLSMIPNLFPILFTLGIMGLTNIPLSMVTMIIGSIAIGLAVDDTVHFMHNFRRYYDEIGDASEAVRRTLLSTGRAMLITSVVLCAGFFIFMFASMHELFNFGLLTGITIIIALIADFVLSPALMIIVIRNREKSPIMS